MKGSGLLDGFHLYGVGGSIAATEFLEYSQQVEKIAAEKYPPWRRCREWGPIELVVT